MQRKVGQYSRTYATRRRRDLPLLQRLLPVRLLQQLHRPPLRKKGGREDLRRGAVALLRVRAFRIFAAQGHRGRGARRRHRPRAAAHCAATQAEHRVRRRRRRRRRDQGTQTAADAPTLSERSAEAGGVAGVDHHLGQRRRRRRRRAGAPLASEAPRVKDAAVQEQAKEAGPRQRRRLRWGGLGVRGVGRRGRRRRVRRRHGRAGARRRRQAGASRRCGPSVELHTVARRLVVGSASAQRLGRRNLGTGQVGGQPRPRQDPRRVPIDALAPPLYRP